MDWVLSGTTVLMLWFMGNKSIAGPIIGFASQFLWFYYIFNTDQWGLLVGASIYTVIHARNIYKWWRKDDKEISAISKKEK